MSRFNSRSTGNPLRASAGAVAALVVLLFGAGHAAAQDIDKVQIVWELPETEADLLADKLDFAGEIQQAEGETVRGAPLVVLVGIAALPSLVDSVIGFYRDLTQGGVIIDATGETIQIVNDTAIPYGTILVRDGDGIEIQNFRSTPKPADLSGAIVEAVKAAAAK